MQSLKQRPAAIEAMADRAYVIAAINMFDTNFDFADAMHVARSGQASCFVTFDKKLAKRTGTTELSVPIELLP